MPYSQLEPGSLLEEMPDAFAYHRILTDEKGLPVDFIFLEVNRSFEDNFGCSKDEVIGKRATEVFPELTFSFFNWFSAFGQVALQGGSIRWQRYFEPLKSRVEITAYRDAPGYFAVVYRLLDTFSTGEGSWSESGDYYSPFSSNAKEFDAGEGTSHPQEGYSQENDAREGFSSLVREEEKDSYRGYPIEEILPPSLLQPLLSSVFELTGIGVSMVDYEGRALVATPGQDLCMKFHRVHPETYQYCKESDRALAKEAAKGNYQLHRCKNHLWDLAVPIFLGEDHLATIITGQFFLVDEEINYQFFRERALQYGFDQNKYLEALDRVPRCTRAMVEALKNFYLRLAYLFTEQGYQKWDLTRMLRERDHLLEVLQQQREELQASEERYREILATIEEGYYEVDLAGNLTFVNEAAAKMLNYTQEEMIGMSYRKLYRDPDEVFRTFNKVYRTGKPHRNFTLDLFTKDGETLYGELSVSLIKDREGNISGFRGVARDVTERVQFEAQLKNLSMYDQLTGLYNRAYFEEELNRLENSREYPITIIAADLDNLKFVNDTLGHSAGDRMLKAAAEVLKGSLRSSDFLARAGGDEFVAILPRTDQKDAAAILKRIKNNLEQYNQEHPIKPIGLSLGVATASDASLTLEELYKQSDDLMYRDKAQRQTGPRTQILDTLLTTLEERDYNTGGHARRLTRYCQEIAKKMGLSEQQISNLALLSQVHDLGKVGIPDQILMKRGPLDNQEWEVMRQHPEKGKRIAEASSELSFIADLILKHHERWDGTGYPLGIRNRDIPVECRILAIVDAYDAMTSDRPYRQAMSHEEALEEIRRCAGTQFDPELVDIFLSLFSHP